MILPFVSVVTSFTWLPDDKPSPWAINLVPQPCVLATAHLQVINRAMSHHELASLLCTRTIFVYHSQSPCACCLLAVTFLQTPFIVLCQAHMEPPPSYHIVLNCVCTHPHSLTQLTWRSDNGKCPTHRRTSHWSCGHVITVLFRGGTLRTLSYCCDIQGPWMAQLRRALPAHLPSRRCHRASQFECGDREWMYQRFRACWSSLSLIISPITRPHPELAKCGHPVHVTLL